MSQKKALEVFAGTENAYKLARKYNVKTAFGTDILFHARLTTRQGAILAKMVRWYRPAEALKMATADNGELMALSGFINPTLATLARSKGAPPTCYSWTALRWKISSLLQTQTRTFSSL